MNPQLSLVLRRTRVQAHQSCDQDRQKELTSNSFHDGQSASYIRARHDIAIPDRRQRNKTKINRAASGKVGGGKHPWSNLLESPIQQAKVDSRQQVSAQRCEQMFSIDLGASHGKA